ncbi:hypothetical protein K8R33_03690 [archaeon]|nr:hypothetical protein [archaeon]
MDKKERKEVIQICLEAELILERHYEKVWGEGNEAIQYIEEKIYGIKYENQTAL